MRREETSEKISQRIQCNKEITANKTPKQPGKVVRKKSRQTEQQQTSLNRKGR